MAIALIAGILWARYKSQGEVCESVEVEVINADSTSFVTPEGVLSDLEHQGLKFVGKRMAEIQASDVEEILGNSPYLEFADIVKCQDGRLLIRVSQLLPVLRVFDGENSYYVNRAGKRMDASVYYPHRCSCGPGTLHQAISAYKAFASHRLCGIRLLVAFVGDHVLRS